MLKMMKQRVITEIKMNSEDEEEDFLPVCQSSFDAPTSISSPSATTSLWDPLEHIYSVSSGDLNHEDNSTSVLNLSVDEDLAVLGLGLCDSPNDFRDEGELTFEEVHTELSKELDIYKPDTKQQKLISAKSDDEEFASEGSTTSTLLREPQTGKRKARLQRRRATKKFAGDRKAAEREIGVRRNPRRTTAAPADYNENRNSQRGKQLTSEFPVNLCKTYNLQHRVYRNKYGVGVEMSNPESFWPADTLDRPTFRDVNLASQYSAPQNLNITWGIATHHLLHCVLAMITRFKSTKTVGFDRVAGKLHYTESLVAQLKRNVEDAGHKKDKAEEATNESINDKDKTKKPALQFVAGGIMLIDLTGDDDDEETDLQENGDWFDELDPCSEDKLCESVCEVLAMVRDVEMRLRNQVAERLLKKIIPNCSSKSTGKSKIEFVPVPYLDDLEELLERASYVYRLANRDVTRQDLNNYLSSVERKEALRQARREMDD